MKCWLRLLVIVLALYALGALVGAHTHAAAFAAIGALPASAQAPEPRFEAATVKRNHEPQRMSLESPFRVHPGGRFVATGMTLRDLLRVAYTTEGAMLSMQQVAGGPQWISTHRFDIVTSVGGHVDAAGGRGMLRALLAERFGLRAHVERREMSAVRLEMARADRRAGPSLKASACAGLEPAPETLEGALQRAQAAPATTRPCLPVRFAAGGGIAVEGVTLADFASLLSGFPAVDRPVLDRTGLPGAFDFELRFVGVNAAPGTGPNLYAALDEQLGLKLTASTEALPVLVVDAATEPTEN